MAIDYKMIVPTVMTICLKYGAMIRLATTTRIGRAKKYIVPKSVSCLKKTLILSLLFM